MDTAIIYGVMNGNASTNVLQFNAAVKLNTHTDTTTTVELGTLVYFNGHFYGCNNVGAGKKWAKLD